MIQATLTEIRHDGFQKWERTDLPQQDHNRYIWLQPFQSKPGAKLGSKANLTFHKGTGGAVGGHWSLWKVSELLP